MKKSKAKSSYREPQSIEKLATAKADLITPAEVVIRIALATSQIISITDEKGVPFGDEPLSDNTIALYGMHVERMPPVASIASVTCDQKPTGCIVINFPDGTTKIYW